MKDEPEANPNLTIEAIGELGVIELFQKKSGSPPSGVIQSIGDDCAVMASAPDNRLLLTTDMLVEDVHFLRRAITPFQLGWKSLAVNVSDVAAMGGSPKIYLLSIALPPKTPKSMVDGLRDGLTECSERYGLELIGGDTVGSPGPLTISITVIGEAPPDQVVLRSGARPADTVMLGGVVGDSGAGLEMIRKDMQRQPDPEGLSLLRAHLEPRPRVDLGVWLARNHLATAMIDVSDGVLTDLGHICEASGVSAEIAIESLPISAEARALALKLGEGADPVAWALCGGEDYCLCFCVGPEHSSIIASRCKRELGLTLTPIGTIRKEPGRVEVLESGEPTEKYHSPSPTQQATFKHF